jgi:hypothetical protein
MADIDLTYKGRVRKKTTPSTHSRRPANGPRRPELVLRIVYLKDVKNMHWRQMGEELGMSHQAPFLLYKRWREWAYSQKENVDGAA